MSRLMNISGGASEPFPFVVGKVLSMLTSLIAIPVPTIFVKDLLVDSLSMLKDAFSPGFRRIRRPPRLFLSTSDILIESEPSSIDTLHSTGNIFSSMSTWNRSVELQIFARSGRINNATRNRKRLVITPPPKRMREPYRCQPLRALGDMRTT